MISSRFFPAFTFISWSHTAQRSHFRSYPSPYHCGFCFILLQFFKTRFLLFNTTTWLTPFLFFPFLPTFSFCRLKLPSPFHPQFIFFLLSISFSLFLPLSNCSFVSNGFLCTFHALLLSICLFFMTTIGSWDVKCLLMQCCSLDIYLYRRKGHPIEKGLSHWSG